jgi:hypothetical protein
MLEDDFLSTFVGVLGYLYTDKGISRERTFENFSLRSAWHTSHYTHNLELGPFA